MPEPRDRFVTANGLALHYLDWGGGGQGVPILLLHGLRDRVPAVRLVAPALVGHGRVLALDQRGHGGSDWPPTGYAPEDFAADVAAFLDALDLAATPPVVVGHSMGGRTALAFAARYPDRLRGLVVVDVGAGARPETVPAIVAELRAGHGPFAGEEEALRALVGDAAPNAATRRYVRYNLRPTADGLLAWQYDLDAAIETTRLGRGHDYWPDLSRIAIPTLLVRGARSDVLSREEAERMVEALPRGMLIEIAGAGHLIPLVRPRELADTIIAWLPNVIGDGSTM
jgi:esterase